MKAIIRILVSLLVLAAVGFGLGALGYFDKIRPSTVFLWSLMTMSIWLFLYERVNHDRWVKDAAEHTTKRIFGETRWQFF